MNENQLKFLYDNYGKSQGFADYNEFKGLMENDANRKLFFDASNKDLGFTDYNEFESLLGVKKKAGTQTASGEAVGQPGQPSAPSFGQKITEKIVNSASETQVPLKTGFQQEQEQKEAEKKAKIPTSKYFEVDVEEKPDEIKAPKAIDPIEVAQRQSIAPAVYRSMVTDKEVFKMPTPNESENYASDITRTYIDYLETVGSSKGDEYIDKYNQLKAKSKEDRSSQDEEFLRKVEGEALGKFFETKEKDLYEISSQIGYLEKAAVTPEQKQELNNLYNQYQKTRDTLTGTSSVYDQYKLQYGKIARREYDKELSDIKRFERLQQGEGKTEEFFRNLGGTISKGVIAPAQVPKALGDFIGDSDYDVFDKFYDYVLGAKNEIDTDFGMPLPRGKSMADLPLAARVAAVGGSAVGSAGLFALGAGAVGATSTIGQAAATMGTSFLISEGDYYQEALETGMNQQDAAIVGTFLAASTSLVEGLIPDIKYLTPGPFRKSIMQAIAKNIGVGMPAKQAAKAALKGVLQAAPESIASYGKAVGKEAFIEEPLGQFAEDVVKEAANASAQKDYFLDTFDPEAYADAVIGGAVASGAMSVFSRPTPKSPVQQELMREIVDRRELINKPGTASDKIGNKEDLKDFNEATEVFDAMSSHSAWKDMPREKQNQAFALAQQAELMKKEQERMKKLRIPDEQKDAEIKRLEDEVNMMFADQLEQQKQAAYDQENIQGLPGQVGVGQELIQAGAIQGAGTEATQTGGVLQAQGQEVVPSRISEINNLEQALFENEVQQNETGTGTMSEQQIADVTAKLDEMRGQNKEGGLNEMETLMKQALGENVITAADIDKMVDEGSVEIKCPPAKAKAKQGMRMGFIPGGKWDIVTEFKGKSHENGGIDIEVLGGKIGYTGKEPNLKAKKGGFWKTLKDVGLTIVDTQLSTIGNVAGIKSMQDIIDEDQYSNDKFDEAGNFAGKLAGTALKVIPVTAPIASAAGMIGGAVNQIGGIDAKNYDPSQHTSKLDKAGDIISTVGTIAGMAVSAGTSASAAKTFAAGDKLSAAEKMSMRMGGINKTLGQATKGLGMIGGGMQQQPQQFLQQTQSNPALQPPAQQTFQNPYQQPQYGAPVQQTYSNSRNEVVTINGVNYAPDQYGNLVPVN